MTRSTPFPGPSSPQVNHASADPNALHRGCAGHGRSVRDRADFSTIDVDNREQRR